MPNYAVINNDNVIVNRIVADSLEIAQEATSMTCIPCDGTSRIGGTWDGSKFTSPVIEEQAPTE